MLPPVCFLLLIIIMKCHSYQNSWSSDYTPYKIPQDVMVDVVNNLALKLLAIHNEGNDNNIAISPYGALSVLVALLEGVRGSATDEIRQAANIPSDLSVIRIGLRDIHRHLKSYFIPEEGFLSGLTLSHDNVTLNREYEDILRFYGFDIDSFNSALYPDMLSTTDMTDSTTESITSTTELLHSSPTTITTSTEKTEIPDTTVKVTTTEQTPLTTKATEVPLSTMGLEFTTNNEKTSETTIIMTSTTEIFDSTLATEISTELTAETEGVSKMEETNITATSGTTEQAPSTSETSTTSTTEISGSTYAIEMSTALTRNTEEVSEQEATSATTVQVSSTSETTTEFFTEANTKLTTDDKSTTLIITSTGEFTSSTNIANTESTVTSSTNTETSTTTEMSSVSETTRSDETTTVAKIGKIKKRGTDTQDIVKYSDESNFTRHNRTARSVVDYLIARYYDDHVVTQRPPPYISENDLYFLVNDKYKETNINYMTYDTVLPFHYIPHLNTLALRFPLDSSKYYLLLLLPENHGQLNKLICELRLNTSLKYIIDNLQYTYVKAIIPSFMLKGYVILTSTFQKLGIRTVFEPRQADFSPMTVDRGIYVTNIEQAITVNIRNYVDPATMNNNNRYLHRTKPVLFKADHSFLYFVIDSEIDVVLMAGKIINPLNSRIR